MKLPVEKFMSFPVVTTTTNANVAYIRELMERKQVNAIPIVKLPTGKEIVEGRKIEPKGIVTSSDLRCVEDERTDVEVIMSKPMLNITRETTAQDAAKLMVKNDVHHLLVMEEDKIVGMVSSMDFVKLIARNQARTF